MPQSGEMSRDKTSNLKMDANREVFAETYQIAQLEKLREMERQRDTERFQKRMREVERMREIERNRERELEEDWTRQMESLEERKKKRMKDMEEELYDRQRTLGKQLEERIRRMETEREEGQRQLEKQLKDMEENFAKESEVERKKNEDILRELERKSQQEWEAKILEMERKIEREEVMAQRREEELLRQIEHQQKTKMEALRHTETTMGKERQRHLDIQRGLDQVKDECQDMGSEIQRERDRKSTMRERVEITERRLENEQRELERQQEMNEKVKKMEQKFEMEREMERKRHEERCRELEDKSQKEWERTRELERKLEAERETAQQREQELLNMREEQDKAKEGELMKMEKQREIEREEKRTSELQTPRKTELDKVIGEGKEWMREIKQKVEKRKDTELDLKDGQNNLEHKQADEREKDTEEEEKTAIAEQRKPTIKGMDWLREIRQKEEKDIDITQQEEQLFLQNTSKERAEESVVKPVEEKDKPIQGMEWLREFKLKEKKIVDSGSNITIEGEINQSTSKLMEGKTATERKHEQLEDVWLGDMGLTKREDKWSEIGKKHQRSREESRQELGKHIDQGEQTENNKCMVLSPRRRNAARKKDAEDQIMTEVNKQGIKEVQNLGDEGMDWLEEIKQNVVRKKRESLQEGQQIIDEQLSIRKERMGVMKNKREREMEGQQVERCGQLDDWLGGIGTETNNKKKIIPSRRQRGEDQTEATRQMEKDELLDDWLEEKEQKTTEERWRELREKRQKW